MQNAQGKPAKSTGLSPDEIDGTLWIAGHLLALTLANVALVHELHEAGAIDKDKVARRYEAEAGRLEQYMSPTADHALNDHVRQIYELYARLVRGDDIGPDAWRVVIHH